MATQTVELHARYCRCLHPAEVIPLLVPGEGVSFRLNRQGSIRIATHCPACGLGYLDQFQRGLFAASLPGEPPAQASLL